MKGPVVENVVLTVHLILAMLLIGVVLLQRSEGGGLGMGGGGGGGVMTGRQAANALSRLTWIFAIGFIITSISLTVIATRVNSAGSIADQLATPPATGTEAPAPAPAPAGSLPTGSDLLPPTPGDAPAAPPAAPAAPAAPSN